MGLLNDGPLYQGPDPLDLGKSSRAGDFVADFANSATGTGENLGWWGKIDRSADPRTFTDDPERAREEDGVVYQREPSAETTGLSGFFGGAGGALGAGAGQALTAASESAAPALWRNIRDSPLAIVAVAVLGVIALGPLLEVIAGVLDG